MALPLLSCLTLGCPGVLIPDEANGQTVCRQCGVTGQLIDTEAEVTWTEDGKPLTHVGRGVLKRERVESLGSLSEVGGGEEEAEEENESSDSGGGGGRSHTREREVLETGVGRRTNKRVRSTLSGEIEEMVAWGKGEMTVSEKEFRAQQKLVLAGGGGSKNRPSKTRVSQEEVKEEVSLLLREHPEWKEQTLARVEASASGCNTAPVLMTYAPPRVVAAVIAGTVGRALGLPVHFKTPPSTKSSKKVIKAMHKNSTRQRRTKQVRSVLPVGVPDDWQKRASVAAATVQNRSLDSAIESITDCMHLTEGDRRKVEEMTKLAQTQPELMEAAKGNTLVLAAAVLVHMWPEEQVEWCCRRMVATHSVLGQAVCEKEAEDKQKFTLKTFLDGTICSTLNGLRGARVSTLKASASSLHPLLSHVGEL